MADDAMTHEVEASVSRLLLDQAERLFRQHATKETLAAADAGEFPEGLWRAVEESGFPLALVPEAAGGAGLAMADVARLIRLSAYHTLPLPLGETILAAALWAEAGGDVPAGMLTLAPTNAADRIGVAPMQDGMMLSGTARRVPWGRRAGRVLVLARDAGRGAHLVLVESAPFDAAVKRVRNLAFEPRDTLDFGGTVVPREAVRPAPPALAEDGLLLSGAFLRAQQMVGAMERCFDHALAYANERVQFGRPIAKFQAVQHMLAIAAGHFAAATASADAAAESFGTAQFALDVAIAKGRVGEAAAQVAAAAHQVHGAMGFTQEHPLHFATRRLWSWRDEFGGEAEWYERLGRLVAGQGGDALWPMLVDR
jgi:acyl-CoA dehydrogenase